MENKDRYSNVMKDKSNYLNDEQIDRLLSIAPTEHVWLLIYLLYRTGRRVSELLELRPKDIDFDNGMVLWNILKKRKPTKIWMAIDDSTLFSLENYIRSHYLEHDTPLFLSNKPNKDGIKTRYTRKWAFWNIRKICNKAGIIYKEGKEIKEFTRKDGTIINSNPGWHPHHLRHSFSINFLKKAKSMHGLSVLQKQLGHSNINTTSTYLEYSQEDRRELLNKVFNNNKTGDDK
jgi:integrase